MFGTQRISLRWQMCSLMTNFNSDDLIFNITDTNYAVVNDAINIQRATTNIEYNTEFNCRTFLADLTRYHTVAATMAIADCLYSITRAKRARRMRPIGYCRCRSMTAQKTPARLRVRCSIYFSLYQTILTIPSSYSCADTLLRHISLRDERVFTLE